MPGSPFHADQPWMHPLLAGEMAGEWEYGNDGLLRMARESGPGQVELFTYNPTTRLLSDPRDLPVLMPGESLHRKFFRPDGALMLWVGTDQISNGGDRVYRLVEVDLTSGTRVGEIFSTPMLVANWGVLYVPTIPEPGSMAVLLAGLLGLAVLGSRRA